MEAMDDLRVVLRLFRSGGDGAGIDAPLTLDAQVFHAAKPAVPLGGGAFDLEPWDVFDGAVQWTVGHGMSSGLEFAFVFGASRLTGLRSIAVTFDDGRLVERTCTDGLFAAAARSTAVHSIRLVSSTGETLWTSP